jgi:quercetin dioxygenase-like cupin family protein
MPSNILRRSTASVVLSCGLLTLAIAAASAQQALPITKLPEQGQRLNLVVGEILVKSSGKDTNGALSQIVLTENPGYATALQSNSHTDISLYVLEGVVTVKVRDQVVAYPANSFVHIPKGTFFAHANLTNRTSRVFMTFSPAGFENYFFERANASKTSKPGTPAYSQTMASIAKKYGVTQTDATPFKNLQRL